MVGYLCVSSVVATSYIMPSRRPHMRKQMVGARGVAIAYQSLHQLHWGYVCPFEYCLLCSSILIIFQEDTVCPSKNVVGYTLPEGHFVWPSLIVIRQPKFNEYVEVLRAVFRNKNNLIFLIFSQMQGGIWLQSQRIGMALLVFLLILSLDILFVQIFPYFGLKTTEVEEKKAGTYFYIRWLPLPWCLH